MPRPVAFLPTVFVPAILFVLGMLFISAGIQYETTLSLAAGCVVLLWAILHIAPSILALFLTYAVRRMNESAGGH